MPLTDEQEGMAGYKGKLLCGIAYAGSGKTFTLIQFAKRNSDKKILYIVFNKSIRIEAQSKFPKNVFCVTSHSLAFARFQDLAQKVRMNISITEYREITGEDNWQVVKMAVSGLGHFMNSSDVSIDIAHIERTVESNKVIPQAKLDNALKAARKLWKGMIDPESNTPCTSNALLKLYQLSTPELHNTYDIILFDEGQDANPVTLDIVLNNNCTKIVVGDNHQMINRWRGAENALAVVEEKGADVLRLTKSFRFGPLIAGLANLVLSMKGEKHPLIGLGDVDKICEAQEIAESGFHAVISRTYMGVVFSAYTAMMHGKRVMWNGGIDKYNLNDLIDLYNLKHQRFNDIKNKKLIQDYGTWEHYSEITEITKDSNMMRAIKMVDMFPDIPGMVATMRSNEAKTEAEADLIVTTAHTSKGLEWDNVILNDDYNSILEALEMKKPKADIIDEMNLLYVAITRAKDRLCINDVIYELLNEYERRKAIGKSIVLV